MDKTLAGVLQINMDILNHIKSKTLPRHVAIIMDGNGRWAKQKGMLRSFGHENGTKAVKEVVEASAELGIKHLTLYAFSTENWKRPRLEVETLMKLLVSSLRKEIKSLQDNNIKLTAIGNLKALPNKVYHELHEVMNATKSNHHMTLTLALSYGSREELLNCVKEISFKVKKDIISPEKIDESIINDGKLPMPNCISRIPFGQILQSNICMNLLLNIKKENDDLGKQVNNSAKGLHLYTFTKACLLVLVIIFCFNNLQAQDTTNTDGKKYILGDITVSGNIPA